MTQTSPVVRMSARRMMALGSVALALTLCSSGSLHAGDFVLNFTNATQIVTTTGKVTTASFTFEAWFKVTTFTAENQVFAQYTSGAGNSGRLIVGLKNAKPWFFIGGNSLDGNATIPSNTWTHIAVTRSGTNGTIYINGVLDKAGAILSNALPSVGISIGGISLLNAGFRGQIADVRAWNLARTQPQIFSAMNSRMTGSEPGLVNYWPINDGSGLSVNELVTNADGTIAGGAAWVLSEDLPLLSSVTLGAWGSTTGGNWSDASKWLGSAVPNGAGHWASFTNQPPAPLSITNDLSPLLLGRCYLGSPSGHTFSGSPVTFTNSSLQATLTASAGTNTFALPAILGAAGMIIDSSSPAAVNITDTVSGSGALAVNPAATNGGSVTLSGANTYTGPTSLGSGTLSFNTIANSGGASALGAPSAANGTLTLGPGSLRFTGGTASTDRGYTVNAPNKAAVICVEAGGNLTFGGRIQATSGGQVKTGPGTVRYTYPGPNTLSNYAQNDGLLNVGANGDGPSQGFYSFGVANGRVVLGAPGQTNTIGGRLVVGLYTTTAPGAETAGEFELVDGVLNMNNNTVAIGRSNGTTITAPGRLSSRLIISGGTATNLNFISLGYNGGLNLAGFNAYPTMDQTAGHVYVQNLYIAESTGSRSDVRLSGGAMDVTTTLRLAMASNTLATLTLSGSAIVRTATSVNTEVPNGGAYATGTLFLCGGTLQTRNIVRNGGNGAGTVYFNGGTLVPNASGQTLQNMSAAYVSTNGAALDTSLTDFTLLQNLLHDPVLGGTADGGLTKSGTNTLTLSGYGSTYTGPTTVSAGTLCVAGALPPANAVTVATDGELLVGGSATQTVTAASLTLNGSGKLGFAFTSDGTSNDRLAVAATPDLANKRLSLYLTNTRLPFTKNGTYTVLTYGGAAPDLTGLSVANPVYGKTYFFAAASGTVTVTIASDAASASVWNVNASGDWSTAANWTTPPANAAGSTARFDDAISSPVTVATAGETVGSLFFNNALPYTLGGAGLTLDNGPEPASVTVESGTHAIAAPLTLAGDAVLSFAPATVLTLASATGGSSKLTAQGNGTLAFTATPSVQSLELNVPEVAFSNALTLASPVVLQRAVTVRPAPATTAAVSTVVSGAGSLTKTGSNVLELASANTYTGVTRIDGGMLKLDTLANGGQPSSIGASAAGNGNLLLGPGTLRYTGPTAVIDRGYTLQAGSGRAAVLDIDNNLTIAGKVQGTSGGFIKTGAGTLYLTYPGAQTIGVNEANIDVVQNLSPFGEGPAVGYQAFTISKGKVVVGVYGQTNTVSARMCVGHCTTASGVENACELEINGGAFICNSTVSLGRSNGTTVTAPGGISSRITVNNGAVTFSLLALGFNNISGLTGFNARPVCDVNAGTLTINSYCNIGEVSGSAATVNVRGGTFRANGKHSSVPAGILLGGPASAGSGTLNVLGTGVVYCAQNVALSTASGATGTLNLNGGQLSASNIVKHTTGSAYLRFNGGLYQPLTAAATLSGLTAAYVSTNGALIDTSLANGYTVAQNLLIDPGLGGAADGGLIKLGTNSLVVAGTGSTFSGPIEVRAGLLKARVCSTNDLYVAAGAAFDALGERATVGDLTGHGPLTNGVIAATGTLDAGTNGAPAGARMTVQNLSLVGGATFACDWATNALAQVTNDFVAVTGTLAPEGSGFVDFGRTETSPIPMPFSATVMSYGTLSGTFSGWKAVNTGLPEDVHPALIVTAENGLVRIEVRYGGTLLMLK